MTAVAFKECRALRHAYTRMDGPPDGWRQPDGLYWSMARYVVHLRCMRCETWRHLAIDRHGGRITASYTYVDGYLLPKGEERIDPDRLRLWLAVPGKWK